MKLNRKVEEILQDIKYLLLSIGNENDLNSFEKKKLEGLLGSSKDPGILNEIGNHLSEPLRVAVSGFMKAGKSTILNSILKEKIVFTASLVATYSVTWFKYGERKYIEIVFKDGSKKEAEISEIEYWTVIDNVGKNPKIRDVSYIIVYYPSDILKQLELIDTPGLFSPEDEEKGDTQNALKFLGLEIEDTNDINNNETSNADAIIYAFERGFKEDNLKVVKAFSTTSINAIGIFSKIDQLGWDPYSEAEPTEIVSATVDGYSQELKDNLYRIMPVTALCVEGSLGINDSHWKTLEELAGLEDKIFKKMLSDAKNFANREYENADIAPSRRKPLLELLGQYGVYLAVNAVKEGIQKHELVDYMYRRSGLEQAYKVILSHFGNRSYIIKTDIALKKIEDTIDKLKYSQTNPTEKVSSVCDMILEKINELRRDNSFVELDCLRAYYSGKIKLSKKINKLTSLSMDEQLLHIMGEYGGDCISRLGYQGTLSFDELKKVVQSYLSDWGALTGIMYNKETNHVAKVIVARLNEMYMYLDALSGDTEY